MAVRVTYIAIAMGGLCGTFAALVGSPSAPAPTSEPLGSPMGGLPMRPIGELGRPTASARLTTATTSTATPVVTAPASASVSPHTSLNPSLIAAPSASAVSNADVPPAPPASPPASPPLVSADSTPPPSTKETLLHAELHCDNRNAAACILAARSYEAGSAGATDPQKALKYRKIALTLWINQCDHNSASACATLADMYREGRGVPQNTKNSDALIARARELCHYNDAPVCHDLPAP